MGELGGQVAEGLDEHRQPRRQREETANEVGAAVIPEESALPWVACHPRPTAPRGPQPNVGSIAVTLFSLSASRPPTAVAMTEKLALPPEAIARAIAFAIEQPASVEVGEIVVRPTAQG